MAEIWKDIIGYEGLYQVSNKGRIKSFPKKGHKEDLILSLILTDKGYYRVGIRKDKNKIMFHVHRLVGAAFIPNPENKPEINHIDGNPLNNCVENLEWCTRSENSIHSYKTGLQISQKGEQHGRSKLKDWEVKQIREIYSCGGIKMKDIGLKFGISRQSVYRIVNNKGWKHI
jgi:hypothetical protein